MVTHRDDYGAPACGNAEPYDSLTDDPNRVTCDECDDLGEARR